MARSFHNPWRHAGERQLSQAWERRVNVDRMSQLVEVRGVAEDHAVVW